VDCPLDTPVHVPATMGGGFARSTKNQPLGNKPAAATQFTGMETFYKKNRRGLSIQFPD
jgi:hypothetical protein